MSKPVTHPFTNISMADGRMGLFRHLGDEIEAAWHARDYDEAVLPSIAARALREADIPSKMSAWDVVAWALEQTELPQQKDLHGRFGEPPITLYNGPRFYIDIYVWLEGTTSIHQHSFCGAFQVFHGSSIHSWYEFEPTDKVNIFMQFGRISMRRCELLSVGDVQEILAGPQYIHSLFHLDQPSVTIVIRTGQSPLFMPQYDYRKPWIAVDPFYQHETTVKRLQIIGALYRSKHREADQMVIHLLERSDLLTSFLILTAANSWLGADQIGQAFNAAAPQARFSGMLDALKRKHGERGKLMADVFERTTREMDIVRRRGFITNPEHRFFLALLLNVDEREPIFSLIRQRFPDADPLEKVLDWTFELSETRVFGTSDTSALGISGFDSVDMIVFEALLKGQTEADLRAEMEGDENIDPEILRQLPQRISKIKNAPIFEPLV